MTTCSGKQNSAAIQHSHFTPNMDLYPVTNTHYTKKEMDFNKCKLFGSMRAGARTFPHPNMGCPACGHATHNTAHMLRSCKSIRHVLNAWLRQVAPSVGAGHMRLNELDLVRSIFDLNSIPTIQDRRATVNFVWDSTQAAIRSATCRGNGN